MRSNNNENGDDVSIIDTIPTPDCYSDEYTASRILRHPLSSRKCIKNSLLEDEDLICPVTCASLPYSSRQDDDTLLLGRGPFIEKIRLFYSNESNESATRFRVFNNGSSVYGIRFLFHQIISETTKVYFGFAFGGRNISFFQMDVDESLILYTISADNEHSISDEEVDSLPTQIELSDWVWDCSASIISTTTYSSNVPVPLSDHAEKLASSGQATETIYFSLAIGFMNNSCEIWSCSIKQEQRMVRIEKIQKVKCDVRCITYSMAFFGWKNNHEQEVVNLADIDHNDDKQRNLAVASGTVFNEILLWETYDSSSFKYSKDKKLVESSSKVNHRLKGHEGVIFTIKFHKTYDRITKRRKLYILSTSDDRTVRLWEQTTRQDFDFSRTGDLPITSSKYKYVPVWTGYDHTSRVWDACFTKNGILSAGEDGTARFWFCDNTTNNENEKEQEDDDTGTQIISTTFSLKGHAYQSSIWGVVSRTFQMSSQETSDEKCIEIAVTIGNDGSAKVWNLTNELKRTALPQSNQGLGHMNSRMVVYDLPLDDNSTKTTTSSSSPPLASVEQIKEDTGETPKKKKKKKKKSTKNDINKQVLCGMAFFHDKTHSGTYSGRHHEILFATRAGMLFSINSHTSKWCRYKPWFSLNSVNLTPEIITKKAVGTCIAIHPTNSFVAIGTSGRDIYMTNLIEYNETQNERETPGFCETNLSQSFSFSCPSSYYSIQKLVWLDCQNLLAFHIKGILIWWYFPYSQLLHHSSFQQTAHHDNGGQKFTPILHRIFNMNTQVFSPSISVQNVPTGDLNKGTQTKEYKKNKQEHKINANNIGVPISYCIDDKSHRLIVGDSRGNISIFDKFILQSSSIGDSEISKIEDETLPIHVIKRAHKKEHVTSITFDASRNTIISVGNDGYLCKWTIYDKNKKGINSTTPVTEGSQIVIKRFFIPVPFFASLTNVWLKPLHHTSEQLIFVGGYYGNNFIVYDMTKKYVLLNIETGGRQRAHEFVIDFNGSFADIVRHYAFAIFVAPSTNSSSIRRNQVHVSHFSSSSSLSLRNNKKVMRYNVGNSIHGEFINGVSWLKTTNVDKLLLLTGSNDTSVGLSTFANDTSKVKTKSIKALYDLPPHESCVRAVSTSRYIDHHSLISTSNEIIPSLLVTCGGKLSMSFYRVEEIDGVISVYYLCSNHYLSQSFANKKSNKKTDNFDIDHRINAAKAVPSQLNPYIHYVFSGDSDGKLELFILNISDEDESGHTNFAKSGKNKHILQNLKIGKEIELTQRPILCLDVLLQSFGASQQQSLFCFVGNTAGEVCVWIFHVNSVSNNEKKQSRNRTGLSNHLDLVVSNNNKDDKPSLIYKAHQVGTNGISATFLNSSALYDDTTDVDIIVCSGGDDQALTTTILRQKQQKAKTLELLKLVRYDGASSSAIKAVKLMNQNEEKDNDFLRLYSVGYDQRLSLWKVNPNVETNTRQAQEKNKDIKRMLQFLCSSFVHVSDISSLDCIQQEEKEYCVVAGEGLEVFSLDLASLKAAQALAGANYLLITAG